MLAPAAASSAAVRSFAPVDDGWVSTRGPSAGNGHGARLLVGGGRRVRAYLKFSVRGLRKPPTRVTLVLHSLSGRHGLLAVRAVHARRWSESTLARRTAPRLGRTLRRHAVHGPGRVMFALTRRVRRSATVTFALTARSRRALAFGSGEASRRRAPRLVVEGPGVAPAPSAPGSGGTSPAAPVPVGPPLTAGGGGPDHATTRAPGSPVLSDAAAAEHVRHASEIRPGNATANHTVPTGQQLADFRSASQEPYAST